MDWVRVRNRRRIVAIWREVTGNRTGDLLGSNTDWKFWEGLLAAVPAGEDDDADLEDDDDRT